MSTLSLNEKRRAVRRRVFKAGRIVFNRGRSSIDCTVRNLSTRGARLEVPSVVGIPDAFFLITAGAADQPCRVVWRRLKELGVAFETR
jgi:hypothetical protein